ncbi:hypothetical protein D9619_006383 [Psilocybe cf. subviscida]|uniref:Ataxin-10 homolog n=1 Tax=Psilocybe cf. subviscida TaxID=2480587 RepID=A0A8H5B5N4_9AGAR|nr:hypothetical protein D9619_006383 [Psilocybe cf. subviscida]
MEYTPGSVVASQFRQACIDFDIKNQRKVADLTRTLDATAQALVPSIAIRTEAGQILKLWPDLRKLWRDLARKQLSFWDNEDSDEEEQDTNEYAVKEEKETDVLRAMCGALAKFTRNLVAGVPNNQLRAYENEPDMRRLLHFYTSWSAMEDAQSVATARVLTQALSNTVTANEELVGRLWETYMNLPEDQVVLIRLLASQDARTLLTTLIFILNSIHGNRKRTQLLAKSKVGVRICIGLLDNMVKLHEAEEGSEGGQAFDIGYSIFTQFIEQGFVPDLYRKFAIASEIVTPHQTTLLKLVDSYLQSTQSNPASSAQIPEILRIHESLGTFLSKRFFTLSEFAQEAMRRSLGLVSPSRDGAGPSNGANGGRASSDSEDSSSGSSSSASNQTPVYPRELDVMLPKACEALVLVTQCIITVCLQAEEQEALLEDCLSDYRSFTNLKSYFIRKRRDDQGIVETLIGVLGLFDQFLPRIQFGKPVNHDGSPMSAAGAGTGTSKPADVSGFSYLKRDLVRLLGVLTHGVKDVQDRTRAAGGLPVVMNLCVVDERNPYLREHAIFTLHGLLRDNPENQKFVDGVKPSQEWADDGTLKTKVGAILK